MIPTYLITLDQLPLTTNGKIDKAALPAPETVTVRAEPVPPRTLIETMLVDLYATVLSNDRIGAADSFFDAGGNSLQALQLIAQLYSTLAVDLDVSAVFLAPTAAATRRRATRQARLRRRQPGRGKHRGR